MNLHAVVTPAISAVNPPIPASIQVSTGYSTAADGSRAPTYAAAVTGSAQVQALSYQDLKQIDGLNLNGTRCAIYFTGQFNSVSRPTGQGGDIITIASGAYAGTWLIAYVAEQWPDWGKYICTQQVP